MRGLKLLSLAVVLLAAIPTITFAATISIVPITATASVGQTILFDVNISGVTDLYAFQFDVFFTPAILNVTNVNDGGFLVSGGFFPGFIDNTAGTITFIAHSLAGPVAGISGAGTLASIRFTAIAPGLSPVTVSNPILLDSSLADISVQLTGAQVTVTGIPEPETISLTLAGAAAVYLIRRRTSRPQL